MLRSILAVLAGMILWVVGFYALAIGLAQLWPDYAIHGRQWFTEGVFSFTPPMASSNLALWALAEFAAGWTAGKISRRPGAVRALAGLLGVYLAAVHLIVYWSHFPWWYNLGVAIPVVPVVLWGGSLAGRSGPDKAQP